MKIERNQSSWRERIIPELNNTVFSQKEFMEMIIHGYEMEEQLLAELLGLTD